MVATPANTSTQIPATWTPPAYGTHAPAMIAPSPQYIYAQPAPAKGSKVGAAVSVLALAIIVAIAGLAGWLIAQSVAPSPQEIDRFQALAAAEGRFNGRMNGYTEGAVFGRNESAEIARYKALIAGAQSFNQGWRRGLKDGKSMYRAPRYTGGYRGGGGYSGGTVNNAIWQAQSLANATGAPVDVIID